MATVNLQSRISPVKNTESLREITRARTPLMSRQTSVVNIEHNRATALYLFGIIELQFEGGGNGTGYACVLHGDQRG